MCVFVLWTWCLRAKIQYYYMSPFAKKLYHGWISTMTSSSEISWKLPPPEMKSWLWMPEGASLGTRAISSMESKCHEKKVLMFSGVIREKFEKHCFYGKGNGGNRLTSFRFAPECRYNAEWLQGVENDFSNFLWLLAWHVGHFAFEVKEKTAMSNSTLPRFGMCSEREYQVAHEEKRLWMHALK